MRLDLKVFVLVEILHQDGHHSFSTIPRKKSEFAKVKEMAKNS